MNFGGVEAVKNKLEIPNLTKAPGYWRNWNNMEIGIENTVKILGHFPSFPELEALGRYDLEYAIKEHFGGIIKVRLLLGYDLEDQFTKSSEQRYYQLRGQKTEKLIIDLMKEWADLNGFSYSKRKQTSIGSGFLEMVCGKNKKYGIDVTNTKRISTIRKKWEKCDYHENLEQLWVIVVGNNPKETIKKLNEEAPKNVIIIDYHDVVSFLNGINTMKIPFNIPLEERRKLEALAECTYSNRVDVINKYKEINKNIEKIKDE